MRSLKFFYLALLVITAVGAAATNAHALELPENLPAIKSERSWTGKSDGETIKIYVKELGPVACEAAPIVGTEEAGKPSGLFHIEFQKCTTTVGVVEKCTGLGDASETILALGAWHLVFDKTTVELLTAMLFTFEPVHFNCGGLFLALLSGSLVCLDLKPMERSTTHLYHCLVEAEKQEDTTWVMSNGQVLVAEPSCSVNSRAALNCLVLMLASDVYQEELEADI